VVDWQALTPGSALAVFNMIDREPARAADCTHVPPAAQAHIIGCG
jgi:hypothetical protein